MNIGGFAYRERDRDVARHIRESYGYDGDLLEYFTSNSGNIVHKWHHYIGLYDRYFAAWRGRPLRFLEIGVSMGGSLQVWRKYFGETATIFGIDIDPRCARLDGQAGQVRIGSQADPDFLKRVVDEMGGVDVVLDDGSHRMEHIRDSLAHLFPALTDGGIYMIEDLHTAYWPSHGGGLEDPANFFNDMRQIIDDMHHWYHPGEADPASVGYGATGLHIHDSMVVIEKNQPVRPVHSRIG